MELRIIKKRTSPLCFLSTGQLVCYRQGELFLLNDNGDIEATTPLFTSWKEKEVNKCRFLSRLLRLGVRTAEAIDDHCIILSIGNMLYEYDFKTSMLSNGYYCGDGIRPLVISKVKNIKGFDDGFVFGGYLGNKTKKPVHIYKRKSTDQWEVVYTFPQGAINHVHNIIADPYRNCLWIYTGDFGEAAAIWKAEDNFNKVERVLCNDQTYRGCVAFALPRGVLYATDSPFEKNGIFLLKPDLSVEKIHTIEGSCIYGCQWKDEYVFQTTVEPTGVYKNKLQIIFCWKKGPGIKDRYVHLIKGNDNNGFHEIYKTKKDLLPFIFQFGTVRFPSGTNHSETLYFQPVATRDDLKLIALK